DCQINIFRWQDWSTIIYPAVFVTAIELSPKMLGGFFDIAQSVNLGVIRNVIKQRAALFKKQRQIIFYSGWRDTSANILKDRAHTMIHIEVFMPLLFE